MKPIIKKLSFGLIVLFAMLTSIVACKKDKAPAVDLPTLTTADVVGVSNVAVELGGEITNTGGGTITKFGLVLSSVEPVPTIALNDDMTEESNGTIGAFGGTFQNLTVNKTYYVRAYATNAKGTAYGDVKIFVIDASGNLYHTVKIGTQTWLLENLKTTKYTDNSDIPLKELTGWANLATDAMCWYGADAVDNKNLYGGLYNWYAVNHTDPLKKLAPSGWRIPTVADWQTLNANSVNNLSTLGKHLKEVGNAHWLASVNITATNSTGFTALPGGYRNFNTEVFGGITFSAYFWSAGEDMGNIFHNRMNNNSDAFSEFSIASATYKNYGFSVRCIKE